MSLELRDSKITDGGLVITGTYRLQHSNPGRGNTTLTLDVNVKHAYGKVTATIPDLEPSIDGGTTEEALDKLADWMERGAKALRDRGTANPIFSNYIKD